MESKKTPPAGQAEGEKQDVQPDYDYTADVSEDQGKGFFATPRAYLSYPLWNEEPFCKGHALTDLIGLARFTDGYTRKRGIRVEVKRGQVSYSIRELAKRWRWSRNKVTNFLKELEEPHPDYPLLPQIEPQKSNVTTLISILNYDEIMGTRATKRAAKGPQKGHRRATETPEPASDEGFPTPNKENKENKENKTTTTPCGGCDENLFSENQNRQTQTGETAHELPADVIEYIELKVEADAAAGKIRSTKSAYRHGLKKRARDGLLDTSDLDHLRQPNKPGEKIKNKIRLPI